MAYRLGYLVIVKRRYRRPWPTYLQDGTVLVRGDKIVRLHLKLFLPRFRGDNSELAYTRYLVELIEPEIPGLARLLQADPAWADFKALFGQSHIVGKLTERIGLETQAIPDWWIVVVDILGRGAMLLSDPSWRCLRKILQPKGIRPPRECWISTAAALQLYPSSPALPVPRLRRLFKYF